MTYLAYRAGSGLAQALPDRVAQRSGTLAGRVMGRAMKGRRQMLSRHVQRAYGGRLEESEVRRHVDVAFESYGRYWLEAFRLPRLLDGLADSFRVEGMPILDEAVAGGKGVIFALPHLGNWDAGGAYMTTLGYPVTVVVEPLQPPELFEWFAGYRRSLGMDVIPLGAGAPAALMAALREGRVVCLVSDRDLAGTGVEVDFFGERTTLPAGPATLALRTGAPILPVAVYFEGDSRYLGVVRPPLDIERKGRLRDDVARITQCLAGELEGLIRRAPDQWHLLQPNWPSDFPATPERPAESE